MSESQGRPQAQRGRTAASAWPPVTSPREPPRQAPAGRGAGSAGRRGASVSGAPSRPRPVSSPPQHKSPRTGPHTEVTCPTAGLPPSVGEARPACKAGHCLTAVLSPDVTLLGFTGEVTLLGHSRLWKQSPPWRAARRPVWVQCVFGAEPHPASGGWALRRPRPPQCSAGGRAVTTSVVSLLDVHRWWQL